MKNHLKIPHGAQGIPHGAQSPYSPGAHGAKKIKKSECVLAPRFSRPTEPWSSGFEFLSHISVHAKFQNFNSNLCRFREPAYFLSQGPQ